MESDEENEIALRILVQTLFSTSSVPHSQSFPFHFLEQSMALSQGQRPTYVEEAFLCCYKSTDGERDRSFSSSESSSSHSTV